MITQSIMVVNPHNGKMAISNALSVSGSLKTVLQDLVDLPMRIERNAQFLAGLSAISSEIGSKFKIGGDEGIRNSLTTRRESFSEQQSTAIQNLNENWSSIKESWINGLESQKDHPKYELYVNIINTGELVKRGLSFNLVSALHGRLVIVTS